MSELAQGYAERGYDVSERASSLVLETPNPDPTGDDYFHGPNPHTVGFGSRGAAAEHAGTDLTVEPGQSTAEALANEGGAGWTGGGEPAETTSQTSGEPDESWRNADIEAYAEQRDIHIPSGANKGEMLEAIRAAQEGTTE